MNDIIVQMPIDEYNRLKDIEKSYQKIINMFTRANPDGISAIFTHELEQTIKNIYY